MHKARTWTKTTLASTTVICTVCKLEKARDCFYKDNRLSHGLKVECKDCFKERWERPENREKHRLVQARRREDPSKKAIDYATTKQWVSVPENKASVRTYLNAYQTRRYREDINFKLGVLLRRRLSDAIRKGFKGGSAVRDLGCSIEKLKEHLESKFTDGMTWDNHGHGRDKWNIDHIMPMAAFQLESRQHVLLACNYLNLQPLWFIENVRKSNRIPDCFGVVTYV